MRSLSRILRPGTELRRFGRTRMTRAAIAVAVCIPLLYGALYLWAFWDPTGHLDRVPVALVTLDTGATTSDGTAIHAGDTIADELVDADSLDWTRTNPTDAAQGLEDGRYYAVLTIPAGFSSAVATAGTTTPRTAPLQVTYDDANGFTTRTILASVMREARAAVSGSIGQDMVDKVLVGVSDIHSGMVDASNGAHDLADGTGSAMTGSTKVSEGAAALATGADQIATGTHDAHTGSTSLAGGASRLREGLDTAHSGTTQLASGAASLAKGAHTLATGLPAASQGASAVATGASDLAEGATSLSSGLTAAADQTEHLPAQTAALDTGAARVADGSAQLATGLDSASTDLSAAAAGLRQSLAAELPDGSTALTKFDATMTQLRRQVSGAASNATTLAAGASDVAAGTHTLATAAGSLIDGLSSAQSGAARLAAGATNLRDGASTLSTRLGAAATGAQALDEGAQQVSTHLTALNTGLTSLAGGAQALSTGATDLDSGLATLDDGSHTLASSSHDLASGAADLRAGVVKLADGATTLADRLSDAVDKIPGLTAAERTANAQVMAQPVSLDSSWAHQAAGNGEGFAPYFIGLSLYVGALILWMLLRPISQRSLAAPVPAVRVVLANVKPAVLLGVLQVALLFTILIAGLGLHTHHLAVFVAFGLLVSAAFIALQQMLNILFGPSVGRLLTLVLLMLQLTSSGGTYPAVTSPGLFQSLNRVLPMTQVVTGFREAITGDLNQPFWAAAAYLVALLAGSLAVSALGARRNRVWTMTRLHPPVTL